MKIVIQLLIRSTGENSLRGSNREAEKVDNLLFFNNYKILNNIQEMFKVEKLNKEFFLTAPFSQPSFEPNETIPI